MQIQVIRDFAGKLTHEKRIFPGFYESGDPRLLGVEDYLVQHGFAQRVNAPAEEMVDAIAKETGVEMVGFGVPLDETTGVAHEGDALEIGHITEPALAEEEGEAVDFEFKGRTIKAKKAKG